MGSTKRLTSALRAVDPSTGLINLDDLRRAGASKSDVYRWTQDGVFDRVGGSLYKSVAVPWTHDTELARASYLSGPQGALGMQSALLAHGFEGVKKGRVHVVTARGARQTSQPFAVHESTDLAPSDIVRVSGLKATTPERSLIDAARTFSGRALDDLVDFAIRRELVSVESITGRFLEVGRRGRPGTRSMRSCLEWRSDLIGPDSTFFERIFDDVVEWAGFPPPIKQYRVVVDGRVYFLDRAWPQFLTWAECDSMLAHATAAQLDADLRRQNDVTNATKMVPLRFSYQQVTTDRRSVADTLAARIPRL